MTTVELSEDLVRFLDMKDQPIVRYRTNLANQKVFLDLLNWFAGRQGLFENWKSLASYQLRAAGTYGVTANIDADPTDNPQIIELMIPDGYFTENGIDLKTFRNIESHFVDEIGCEVEVIETKYPDPAHEGQHLDSDWCTRGTFFDWSFHPTTAADFLDGVLNDTDFPYKLRLRGVVQNKRESRYHLDPIHASAFDGVSNTHFYQCEDVFLRLITSIFEKYITPKNKNRKFQNDSFW